jgi:7-cyano-7-deazaguanine synthase
MDVLLFSGGIDSTALAWGLRPDLLFFVDYGQVAAPGERRATRAIAREIDLRLEEIVVDLSSLGSGTMVGGPPRPDAPPEHWPFRNQMLLTIAAMRCSALGGDRLILGTVAGDEEHDDGTADFRSAMAVLLTLQSGPHLYAPGVGVAAERLVERYEVPDRVLHWTFSCHTGEWACGSCRGCHKHRRVMEALADPEGPRR